MTAPAKYGDYRDRTRPKFQPLRIVRTVKRVGDVILTGKDAREVGRG